MNINFFLILLACAIYGTIHSLLASLNAKSLAEKWFGVGVRRYYRLFFSIQGALTLLPILALMALLPDSRIYTIPFPFNIITIAIQLAAGLGLLLGVGQTGGMNFLGLEQVYNPASLERPSKLVTVGFYRRVRHPLYSFSLLFLWLTPLMTWNLLALNIGLTLYFLVGIIFEERKLELEFGEAYREYKKRTPMLLPKVW